MRLKLTVVVVNITHFKCSAERVMIHSKVLKCLFSPLLFVFRTVRSNSGMKSSTPNNEKESTTNDNGSSTDDAESDGNNRLVAF